jgi:hypothetical protein
MKKIEFGQTIQILANIGVIAGIVFLAVELDQNNAQMTAQTRNNVAQSVIDNIQMGMEPRLVTATLKLERGEPLTAEEDFLMGQLANATLRLWENTFYQYRVGLFDEEEIEADMVVWRELMQEDAFTDHWRERRSTYSRQFRDVIDNLIRE